MGESLLKRTIDWLQGGTFSKTKFGEFTVGVLVELDAVTWPTKQEVYNSTVVVLITMIIFMVYTGAWDLIMNFLREQIFL